MDKGICFICNEACDPDAYCHRQCALEMCEQRRKEYELKRHTVGVPKKEWGKPRPIETPN